MNGNMVNISAFDKEEFEYIKNYVYRLIDPRNGETFYVGRGKGNRVFDHIKSARDRQSHNLHELNSEESYEDEVTLKIKRIIGIENTGLEVIHVIHRHGMNEAEAIQVEAALIDAYPGLTNIMGGQGSNELGPMHVSEIIRMYQAQELVRRDNDKLLLICINKSIEDRDLYNATRYAWPLNIDNAKKVDYVLAESGGIVRAVYKPIEWLEVSSTRGREEFKNLPKCEENSKRIGFIGEDESKTRDDYIGKRTPPRSKGAAFPVRYIPNTD